MITRLQLQDANNARSIYNSLQEQTFNRPEDNGAIFFFLYKMSNNLEEEGLFRCGCLPCCHFICYLSIHDRAERACR